MATTEKQAEEKSSVSKIQLAVGAASLFLFIVGLKRTFRVEEPKDGGAAPADGASSGGVRTGSGRTR